MNIKRITLALLFVFLLVINSFAASAGTTAANFLKIPL